MGRGWGGPDPRELVQVLPGELARPPTGAEENLCFPLTRGPLPRAGALPGT